MWACRSPQYRFLSIFWHSHGSRSSDCRTGTRWAVDNAAGRGVTALAFEHDDGCRLIIISREPVGWQTVRLKLPGFGATQAEARLLTAAHPLQGNDVDHDLLTERRFPFTYHPGEPIPLPANSVLALFLPGSTP